MTSQELLNANYTGKKHDKEKMERVLVRLLEIYSTDPDGLNKSGFYEYVLSWERNLI